LRNIFNSDSLLLVTSISSVSLNDLYDGVNEFSEILSNRKIDKNILEKNNKIFTGKTGDTLKTLEFSQWVH